MPVNGLERLRIMHDYLNQDSLEKFAMKSFKDVVESGLTPKNFITPTSFDFRAKDYYKIGDMFATTNFLVISAPEISDEMLADILNMEDALSVTMHIDTLNQTEAMKYIKGKLSDINKMKIEEQKKAIRSGYDMDIIPPDIETYSEEAHGLLKEMQSRNERLFKVTFLITSFNENLQKMKDFRFKVKISIALAKAGWYNDSAMVNVKVEKIYGDSKFKINTIEAKIGSTGSWVDITDDKAIEITENCTVYVKVTDMNGQEYEKNRFIKCFDTVPPTLNAAVSEGLLTVLTYDTESGVKNIYINEYSFDPDENGVVSVRLQKFDSTYQYFYIYAIDNAGNSSTVYTVNNPYYKDKTTEEGSSEENTEDPADSLPDNGSATVTNPSTGAVTSVTDEAGKDISKTVNKKQFYTREIYLRYLVRK